MTRELLANPALAVPYYSAKAITPEQAYAMLVAGGVQPWSTTPEAALVRIIENRRYQPRFDPIYGENAKTVPPVDKSHGAPYFLLPTTGSKVLASDAKRLAQFIAGHIANGIKRFRIGTSAGTDPANIHEVSATGAKILADSLLFTAKRKGVNKWAS